MSRDVRYQNAAVSIHELGSIVTNTDAPGGRLPPAKGPQEGDLAAGPDGKLVVDARRSAPDASDLTLKLQTRQ